MATISETLTMAAQQHHAGQFEAAQKICQQILAIDPNHVEALHLAGLTASRLGRQNDAIALIRRAIALNANEPIFYTNLAAILRLQGSLDEAIAACQTALQLQPSSAKAHNNLGMVLHEQGKLDEATACYKQAAELNPKSAETHSNLGTVYKDLARLDEAIGCFRRALELKPGYFAAYRNLLFTLSFHPGYSSAAILEEHQRWNDLWGAPLAKKSAPHANDVAPDRRLRVGYVSPNFRTHCQTLFTVPLVSSHDHAQFEITCYSDVTNPDGFTQRLQSYADKWRNIAGLSDEALAQLVRGDQIDILVDLTMHMHGGRLLAFARKPAPVQVCWLAYPGTTGLEMIDYRLTDPLLDPPGVGDDNYSERSIRLPDCFWCYDPLTNVPAVNPLPALARGSITFGCLNNFCKVNADVLGLWSRVLSAVEGSRLILLAPQGSARQEVLKILQGEGIAEGRVTFVGRQPRAEYLQTYHQIDIGLDTFPYNGHTTSLDAFWMGVPVVTLIGKTVVGRAGLCQLTQLGLTDLAADSTDQFVEISTRLADDLPRLQQLRASLRATMENSPLMDAKRFAHSIEAAYRTMWRQWCDSRGSGQN